ncbi:GroES-like protein [Trichoderma barbatum]
MKALVGGESGGYRLADDIDIPASRAGTMLCRVHAVGLNPYDAKIVDYSNTPGAVGGCDFAGIVVSVGSGVTRFKTGDRVLAVTFGLNPSDKTAGAFAEYALATEDLSCHVPDSLTLTQASSMGLGIATAGLALFQAPGLQLPMPRSDNDDKETKEFVLVAGGATGTGTMAIQLLKYAGYTPIVSCSPANNHLCESYGAAACFDYRSATCAADIRHYTSNSLTYVFDCVTDAANMKLCYDAIAPSGGHYVALEPITPVVKYTRRDIRADWLMTPSVMGTAVELAGSYGRPSTPAHREFASELFVLAEKLLANGVINNHPLMIRDGGLASVPTYLQELRHGHVRAKRQVVPLIYSEIEAR